jgi:hypothetical protein
LPHLIGITFNASPIVQNLIQWTTAFTTERAAKDLITLLPNNLILAQTTKFRKRIICPQHREIRVDHPHAVSRCIENLGEFGASPRGGLLCAPASGDYEMSVDAKSHKHSHDGQSHPNFMWMWMIYLANEPCIAKDKDVGCRLKNPKKQAEPDSQPNQS